jgi:hypothetical protein
MTTPPELRAVALNMRWDADVEDIMMSRHRILLVSLVSLVGAAALAQVASASHYRLSRVSLADKVEQRQLATVDIFDTKVLLRATQTLPQRVWLARATGIPLARVTALATQCDLLRLDSVGPSMVTVFQDAGVIDVKVLAAEDPVPLLDRLRVVTKGTPMRYKLPDVGILRTWIAHARRLPRIIDDVPARD